MGENKKTKKVTLATIGKSFDCITKSICDISKILTRIENKIGSGNTDTNIDNETPKMLLYSKTHPNYEDGWDIGSIPSRNEYRTLLGLGHALPYKGTEVIVNMEVLNNKNLYKRVFLGKNPIAEVSDGVIEMILVDNWRDIDYSPYTEIRITTDNPNVEIEGSTISVKNPDKDNLVDLDDSKKARIILDINDYFNDFFIQEDTTGRFFDLMLDKVIQGNPVEVEIKIIKGFEYIDNSSGAWDSDGKLSKKYRVSIPSHGGVSMDRIPIYFKRTPNKVEGIRSITMEVSTKDIRIKNKVVSKSLEFKDDFNDGRN